MATNLSFRFFPIIALAISFLSFVGCSGCDTGFAECVGPSEHSFQQKVLFEPERLQYHIGDTILISSKFSCQDLLNLATGFTEDYCGLKSLSSSLSIHLLYHFSPDSLYFYYALDNFDFVNIEGNVEPFNHYASAINFQIKDNEYSFKIGIIPKVVGKYGVYTSDSGPANLPGNERCDTGSFEFINGNINNHVELIEEYSGAENVSDFEKTHLYYFEVIP